ncbi:MAG: zinc-dependent metalloprotease, partial [Bacteroidota bacterium]
RFSSGFGGYNPDAQTEDMGDDPVAASGYAVANLQRVVPNLIDWTSTPGEGYGDLAEIYGELQGMYRRYMGHVVTVVGGVKVTPKSTDQAGAVYDPIPRAEQERALSFLGDNVFDTPEWLLDREILRRIEHAGAVDRLRSIQVGILRGLLDPGRLHRLVEREAIDGGDAWPLSAYMDALRGEIWSELDARRPAIETQRRHLQRGYIEALEGLLTTDERPLPPGFPLTRVDISQSDIRAAARAQLKTLRSAARRARGADAATRAHLDDIADRIDAILDPEG